MKEAINTLTQLQQMKERAVNKLTTDLAKQQQLCQRHQQNINAISQLHEKTDTVTIASITSLNNAVNYKKYLQKIIDWQRQEKQLAEQEATQLKVQLTKAVCRQKTVDLVLEERIADMNYQHEQQQQKINDGLSVQAWLRNRNQQI